MAGRLDNFRVALAEHRYGPALTQLLQREGATVLACPLVKETPIEDKDGARRFVTCCETSPVDYIVFYTGVGVDFLFRSVTNPDVIARARILARGPKAVAALKRAGMRVDLIAEEPTTAGIARTLSKEDLAGRSVLVQSYGEEEPDLVNLLRERGARVTAISIYRYTEASDRAAVDQLIGAILAGAVDAMMFTSAIQIRFLLEAGRAAGVLDALHDQLRLKMVLVSIGEVTGRSLAEAGLSPQVTPLEPKMAPMVEALAKFVEQKRKECSIPSSST